MKFDDNRMIDVFEAEIVEITLGAEGQVWVNVDGTCRFRSAKQLPVVLVDNRHATKKEKTA